MVIDCAMSFAFVLGVLLCSSAQFVSSEAERSDTNQDWVKCRYHSDCLNGGSCELDSNNELSCKCGAGWTGTDCNYVSKCENGNLINGTCICNLGFYGCACNVLNCSRGGCAAHGKCSADGSHCKCQSGWSGSLCEINKSQQKFRKGLHEDWKTFQRRMIFDIDFKKTFSEYEEGFGDVEGVGDFWLGLKKIHEGTKQGTWEMRIDIVAFNGSKFFNEYSGFKVLDPPLYNITWSSKSRGNTNDKPGSGMDGHKGMPFSAKDRDQDNAASTDCSNYWGHGGWWFDRCHYVYLNTNRATSSTVDGSRMRWDTGRGDIPLIGSTMKMRRVG